MGGFGIVLQNNVSHKNKNMGTHTDQKSQIAPFINFRPVHIVRSLIIIAARLPEFFQ